MIEEAPTAPDLRTLPGPRGGLKIATGFRPQIYLQATREHGDVVCINEERRVFLISHPEHVKQVLQDNQANYRQNTRKKILMGGQSLALSHGDAWRQRRRLLQPVFHQQRLAMLAGHMTGRTERMLAGWGERAARGGRVDVAEEMIALSLDLLIDNLLGDEAAHEGGLRGAVTTAFEYFNERNLRAGPPLPVAIPTLRNLRLKRALARLARSVRETVERRRATGKTGGEAGGDLLSMMLAARDEQSGEVLNDEQLKDELMMLLVMGHMTTAMALTWTFYLLARQPEAEEGIRSEMAAVLGGRPAGFQDLPRLSLTRMVIEESLRIFPPSWSFSRFVVADDEIGGHLIPAGSVVQISPYVTHRRPDLWESPERFDPGRFDPAHAAERPRFAYYPFGGGTRSCIARDLVMLEMPLVLTTVLAAYHLRAVPGHPVAPLAGITLRPRAGMPMTLTPPAALERPAKTQTKAATLPGLLFSTATAPGRDGAAELRERVRRLAVALERSGIAPGERVAIFAENSRDWRVADLAALTAGAVTVPLLPDLPLDEAVRLLGESGARLAFIGGSWRLTDLLARRAELPGLLHWVFLGGIGEPDGEAPRGDGVSTLEELLATGGAAGTGQDLATLAGRRLPEEPATLVFTPGTAGAPRPVLLTHGNLAAAVQSLAESLPVHAGEVAFSCLPLALLSERALGYLCLLRGATVAYAGLPATPESIAADLRQVRPQILSTTPATWKHFLNGVFAEVQQGSPAHRRRFGWAVQVGRASLPQRLRGRRPPGLAGARLALADRLVFAGIRERLGGRLRLAVSGGTRLPHGWITLLWAMGIPVYEGYGLAETVSAVTFNTPGAVRPGTAGHPLPGVEIRIAADGEILVRGDNVAPSAASAAGWLATGDAGFFDDAGMLILLGRKEELFVDADGTTVAPGPLAAILTSSHFVAHALVAGETGGHPAALLAPDFTMLEALCRKRGIPVGPVGGRAALVAEPQVREIYRREVDGFNQKLAAHDRIRAWELVADEWSVASGELTAAGTLRRPAVLAKYRAALDRLASLAKQKADGP